MHETFLFRCKFRGQCPLKLLTLSLQHLRSLPLVPSPSQYSPPTLHPTTSPTICPAGHQTSGPSAPPTRSPTRYPATCPASSATSPTGPAPPPPVMQHRRGMSCLNPCCPQCVQKYCSNFGMPLHTSDTCRSIMPSLHCGSRGPAGDSLACLQNCMCASSSDGVVSQYLWSWL